MNGPLRLLLLSLLFLPTAYAKKVPIDRHGRIDELSDYNFGIVIHNSKYTIYRSKRLGKEGLQAVKESLASRNLPFPKTIIYMNSGGYEHHQDFAVQEFLLQKDYGYKFYHSYGEDAQRTYIDGRNPLAPRSDIDLEDKIGTSVRRLIPLRNHPAADGGVDAFERVLNLVLAPENQPVLIHCQGGRHRTGMVALAIRYLQGGQWTKGKTERFLFHKLNPAGYEYSRYNRSAFLRRNINFIKEISKRPFFKELKRKHQKALNLP